MIIFRLSMHSGAPVYLQIVQQVKQALQLGLLRENDKLPTVKEVVSMVAVNPNTIVKAYKELEREGLVVGRAGLGTFVIAGAPGPPPEIQQMLAKKLAVWMKEAKQAGLDEESIEGLYAATIRDKRRDMADEASDK